MGRTSSIFKKAFYVFFILSFSHSFAQFYVDGVYYARPAATILDFVDIERIEVLRGPQGTLFGKNTTARTFNVTTKQPSFTTGGTAEISYGNYGFIQAKTSVTGAITDKLANRFSASGTHRDGTIYNSRTNQELNDINSIAIRDQLLYKPNDNLKFIFTGDYNRLRADGYAQVIAGVVTTKRAALLNGFQTSWAQPRRIANR